MRAINIYFQAAKYNLKIFKATIIISSIYSAFSLMFFSFKLADTQYMARFAEYYLSAAGILLFPHITMFEEENNVHELVYSKQISHKTIFLARIIILLFINLFINACMLGFAKYQGAVFEFNVLLFGGIISSLFLGVIGILIATIFKNRISGYLIGFSLYLLNFQVGEKTLGKLYLFTLITDNFQAKIRFLMAALLMIFIVYFIVHKRD